MRLLAFFLGEWVYVPYSWAVKLALRARGVRVGRRFLMQGVPRLRLRGKASNLVIGDGVTFTGDVDLRNREDGRIVIGDRCRIDHGVRLVAARGATLSLGEETEVGLYSVFNCGADVTIGRGCMVSGFVYIQSSNHGMRKGEFIKRQPHVFEPVRIGDDVLLASHATVLAGVTIGDGAVVAAKAVVTKDVPAGHIVAGIPAHSMGERL